MIEQRAVIIALSENQTSAEASSIALLEIERQTACGLCGQTRGCGNRIWGGLLGHQSSAFKAQNSIDAQVGQCVVVGIEESALLKAALLLYTTPLLMMFVFAGLAQTLWQSDVATSLAALTGLLVAWLWLKTYLYHRPYLMASQPQVLRLAEVTCQISKPI